MVRSGGFAYVIRLKIESLEDRDPLVLLPWHTFILPVEQHDIACSKFKLEQLMLIFSSLFLSQNAGFP